MHGINHLIFASKKYIILKITELESLDFPRIWGQNYNTWRIFQAWNTIMSNLMTCMIQGQLDIILWVKMLRSLVYTYNKLLLWIKIMICHTFQNPNMKFHDFSLALTPFQNFPGIISNSLTIPWPWKNIFFPDFSLTRGNPARKSSVIVNHQFLPFLATRVLIFDKKSSHFSKLT